MAEGAPGEAPAPLQMQLTATALAPQRPRWTMAQKSAHACKGLAVHARWAMSLKGGELPFSLAETVAHVQ